MDKEYINDLMDEILKGVASVAKQEELKSMLAKDPALMQEFRLRQLEHEAIEILVEDDLRSNMSSWDEVSNDRNSKLKKVIPARKIWRPIGIAASIALIVGVFLWISWPTLETRELALKEYEPNFSTTRSEEGSADAFSVIIQILQDENEQEYARARSSLKQLGTSEKFKDAADYYLGHLAWAEDSFDIASQHFERVSHNSSYGDEAKIYHALALLASNDIESAKKVLKSLVDTRSNLSSQAQRILDQL